ncbi:MAG: hypothetical protein E7656_03135 [Ruminococcaceae bacterium]|nr:hypothetical protein [Oscillospiraceae bacterium]
MSISEKIKSIIQNEQKVYDAGKKAEYDSFWDSYQLNGARTDYSGAFACPNDQMSWTAENFKPKYDIIIEKSGSQCFYLWEHTAPIDLGGILAAQGVRLDTSKATTLHNFMKYGYGICGVLPTIDCSSAGSNTTAMFYGCKITGIEKLVVTDKTVFTDMFNYCYELCDLVIEGKISTGALNLKYSTGLSADSIKSVIDALSDSTTGLSLTLPAAAQTTYAAKYGQSAWNTLIDTKRNWTIAFV